MRGRVYHACTVKMRVLFFAAGIGLATLPAAAQELGAPPAPSSGWELQPRERHILVRAEATVAGRFLDPYSYGRLAPPGLLVDGTFAFLHVGRFLLGPSLGFQAGWDQNGGQYAVQPGAMLYRRFTNAIAAHARVAVPLMVTRGTCERPAPITVTSQFIGAGYGGNRTQVQPPAWGFCPELSVGVEAAVGAAYYVRSGIAITAEAVFDLYFGNGGSVAPILGGGLGVLIEYEVLP